VSRAVVLFVGIMGTFVVALLARVDLSIVTLAIYAAPQQYMDPVGVVVLTEDTTSQSPTAGCDAISIHDYRTGEALDRGLRHISPGRIAGRADMTMFAANHTNFCGQTDAGGPNRLNPQCTGWLALRQSRDTNLRSLRDGFYTGVDVAAKAGIAFIDDGTLLVATANGAMESATIVPRAPFGVVRVAIPDNVSSSGALGAPLARIVTSELIGEILPIPNVGEALLIGTGGSVLRVDTARLQPVAAPIAYPTAISPHNSQTQTRPAIEVFHATATGDGRFAFISRVRAEDVAIVDTNLGSAALALRGPDVAFTGGVAMNNGWINQGLLAVHAVDRVIVASFEPPDRLIRRGEIDIVQPRGGASLAATSYSGPLFSIAWTTDGSHIIAAQDGQAEFAVIEVVDEGRQLVHRRSLTACLDGRNLPNDIWTANGLITPTFTPTSDLPPTATPKPSPSPSPTPTATPPPTDVPSSTPAPSATPSLTPSPTTPPRPIYLPLALPLRCDPAQQRVDVALVLDASSSMAELTRSGRPKIDAALDAARAFLDLLALDDDPSSPGPPNPDGDQAAIVAFHADAWLLAPLTADRAALDTALDAVVLGQQTRLDRAVAVGAQALSDVSRRRPGNLPVLVLLTDGRANPVPVDVAVAEAAASKAAGVTLFTIGLGDDLDAEALAAMASTPDGFLRAPDAEDLAAVYAQVARSIPCARTWP